jgi:hypothetical protein
MGPSNRLNAATAQYSLVGVERATKQNQPILQTCYLQTLIRPDHILSAFMPPQSQDWGGSLLPRQKSENKWKVTFTNPNM